MASANDSHKRQPRTSDGRFSHTPHRDADSDEAHPVEIEDSDMSYDNMDSVYPPGDQPPMTADQWHALSTAYAYQLGKASLRMSAEYPEGATVGEYTNLVEQVSHPSTCDTMLQILYRAAAKINRESKPGRLQRKPPTLPVVAEGGHTHPTPEDGKQYRKALAAWGGDNSRRSRMLAKQLKEIAEADVGRSVWYFTLMRDYKEGIEYEPMLAQ